MAEIGQMILAALGALVLISKAGKAVSYLFTPFTKIRTDVKSNKEAIRKIEVCVEENKETVEELTTFNKSLCASQIAMLNHFIDGNGVVGMKKVREELQKVLY